MRQVSQSSRWMVVAAMLIGAALGLRQPLAAAPEPNVGTTAWELQFIPNTPAVISVVLPGEKTTRLFWYMTYSVTNRTSEDQLFLPDIWLATDNGDLIQANRGISPIVFEQIKSRIKNPLLESPTQVVGTLLQGPDHARDGVAIWPVPDHDVDNARIFIAGLSGETQILKDPVSGEDKLFRRNLMLEYSLPGDASHAGQKVFNFVSRGWIMR